MLIAVIGSDELNIVACMAAKLVTRDRGIKTVSRISNPDYIDKPVVKNKKIGIDAMLCPELILASEIDRILSVPYAIAAECFAEGKIEMMEFSVSDNKQVVGKKFRSWGCPVTISSVQSCAIQSSSLRIIQTAYRKMTI